MFGCFGTASSSGFSRFSRFFGLMRRVELQIAVDPVYPLVVPAMAFDVPQMQKAESESPCAMGFREACQQVGDPLVLGFELRDVAVAALADPEGPAGKCYAHAFLRHSILGQFTTPGWPSYFFPRASLRSSFCIDSSASQRFWYREGLKVPQKQPKRSRLWLNDGSCIRLRPEYPNHVWSFDFVEAQSHDGRSLRLMTLIDEFTRKCLAIRVARRINAIGVIETWPMPCSLR